MLTNIILQNCGFSTAVEKDDKGTIDVQVQALHTGIFVDMNGTEVVVDREMLEGICNTYNESARICMAIDSETDPKVANLSLDEFDNRNAPNQVNHNASDATLTVGHVIGLMQVKDFNGKSYLFCKLRVKGTENVERVRDKRWRNLSVQFNPETYEFVEISWVVKGAAYEAHTLMGKSENAGHTNFSQISRTNLDKIHTKQKNITLMKCELDATKHLIALSKHGVLNMAQVTKIKAELAKFNDPKAVIELMESVIPENVFKPKIIKNQKLMEKLLEGTNMATRSDASISADPIEALKNVVLGDGGMAGIQHSNIGEDDCLSYGDMADKHMDLMSRSMAGYESGDMEMGRKYGELAKKLAGEIKGGKAKLSDYEVEEKSKDSDDVKELAKKIKAAEEEIKEDVKKELAAFEDKMNVALAAQNVSKAEFKTMQDCIIELTKLSAGVK